MNYDVVIIGGGALGVALAYHLSRSGSQLKTAVLEREPLLGVHASGKNAGMIRKLYRHAELTEWTERSTRTWPANVRDRCFVETGSFVAGRTLPGHHAELFAERSATIDGARSVDGVLCPTDGLLDSPLYLSALRSLVGPHAQIRPRHEVMVVERAGSHWEVETRCGFRAKAPWVVNASGAWINRILAPSLSVEALPYARHLFVVDGWDRDYMPAPGTGFYWDEREGWYMRRWDEHTRLVSSCDRIPALPETFVPPPNTLTNLAETVTRALPTASARLGVTRHWHCFRTYTQDQLPIWGEDPRAKGLFWLAAFGGFGMSTSFAAAADAAEVISGRRTVRHPDFSPLRVECAYPPQHDGRLAAA